MKWTKFSADFEDGGYLYYYSLLKNKYIKDTCFLVDDISPVDFEKGKLFKEEVSKKMVKGQYHKWHCQKVPKQYLESQYFDPAYYTRKKGTGATTNADLVKPHLYEIFVGGWLHFFDTQVQNGYSDYALYFDWDFECKSVTGYILQLMHQDKQLNINVNVNITNPPGSQDPPPPPVHPPW
jgi:hypothetical protein